MRARWLLAVLLLLAPFAQAQAATESQAIASCLNNASALGGYCYGPNNVGDGTPNTGNYWHCKLSLSSPTTGNLYPTFQSGAGNCSSGGGPHNFDSRCAGGVDYANGTCFPDPPTEAECLARSNLGGSSGSGTSAEVCADGCSFAPDQDANIGIQIGAGPMLWTAPSWKPTGGTCTAGPSNQPTPLTNDQACIDAGNGMTMCLRADGQHCATASTGKQICWRPGETGTKFSDNVAQKRVAGSITPTAPTPPEGESFTQGPSTTATTKAGTSTFNTTTTNFITTGGTDAGGSEGGSGEPGDGSGNDGNPDDGENYNNDDGSGAHQGDSIWGADETLNFAADESGLGFGTTCPAPPSLDLLGGSQFDWSGMCEVLTALGLIILAAAHMHALYILVEA